MERKTSLTDKIRLLIVTMLAAAAGVVFSLAPGSGVAVAALGIIPSTSFELDGNLPGNTPGIGYDWADPYGPGLTPEGFDTTGLYYVSRDSDVCASSSDNIGASGPQVKLDDGPIWRSATGQANPGQTDLAAVWTGAEKVKAPNASGSQIFDILYVGYELCQTSNGSFNAALYLDGGDSKLPFNPADTPTGSTDDRLLVFEFDPSKQPTASLYLFNGSSWILDQTATVPGSFEADVSSNRIIGEAAINLTTFAGGILSPDSCDTVTVAGQAATVSGGSLTSAVKDIVNISPLEISNCGGLDVTKASLPADLISTDDFPYVVDQQDGQPSHDDTLDASGVDGNVDPEPDDDISELSANIQVGITDEWRNVISQPDYQVDEAPPPGWELVTITCDTTDLFDENGNGSILDTISVEIYKDGAPTGNAFLVPPANLAATPLPPAVCTMTNSTSGVVVSKTAAGDPQQEFAFTVHDNTDATQVGAPSLVDGGSSQVFAVTPGHEVTITETLPVTTPSWSLAGIACDNDVTPSVNLAAGTATFNTLSGVVVTCTYTNNQQGQIEVVKTGAGNTTGPFEFDPSYATNFTLNIGDPANNSGDLAPGQYTVEELLEAFNGGADPDFVGSVECVTTTIGSDTSSWSSSELGLEASITLGAGDIVTCTFDNLQNGRIIVDKTSDAGDGTFAFDTDGNFDWPGGDVDSITTDGGGTTLGDELVADVAPGTYTVTELNAAGFTLDSISCTDTDSTGTDSVATFVVAAGETVTCTFTNTRKQATFTLAKTWGTQTPDGVMVGLSASATGPSPIAEPIDVDATSLSQQSVYAPADPAARSMTIYSGQTITFSELFEGTEGDGFNTTLDCSVGEMELTLADDRRSGTIVVGDDPSNVACTFNNIPKESGVTLVKTWVDSLAGDTADLELSTSLTLGSDSATSVAPEVPGEDNSAFVPVVAGDVVTFTEVVSAPDNYTTSFDCSAGDAPANAPVQSADEYTYTLLIDTTDVADGKAIVCRFVNTRIAVDLTVEKSWVNAKAGDVVSITSTGGENDVDFQATAGTAGDPPVTETGIDPVTYTVYAGEEITFSEVFDVGDPLAYETTFSCTGADSATDEVLTVSHLNAATGITCTYENDRNSFDVRIAKSLIPDDGLFDLFINGDHVDVRINGGPLMPSGGDTAISDPVPVFVGDTVTFGEAAAAGSNPLSWYTTTFSCDNGIDANPIDLDDASLRSGEFVMPNELPLDEGEPIICTFTNRRNTAELTVVKVWGDSPQNGDAVSLTITGGLAIPTNGTNSNDGEVNDTDGSSTVYAGETITVTEAFTTGTAANYDSTLECVDDVGDLVELAPSLSESFVVPSAPTDIECTFTNVRKRAELSLRKAWVNGASGDTADLTLEGEGSPTPVTKRSVSINGNSIDVANVATLTVYAGETVDLDEVVVPGVNYDSELICTSPTNDPSGPGRSHQLVVDPADDGTGILCTYLNTRLSVVVELHKDWGSSPQNGDAVELRTAGSLIAGVDGVDSNDGIDEGDSIATVQALAGETIILNEEFTEEVGANYDTTLECGDAQGAPVASALTYTDGALTGTLAIEAADAGTTITCTFTNVRKSTDLVLRKSWVEAVADDEVNLSITATDPAGPVTALADGGSNTSGEVASTTVYAGEVVTFSEDIDPNGTNVALYDATGFVCSGTTTGTQNSATNYTTTVTADEIDAANAGSGEISCEFTNAARRGDVTVTKMIDGVNDGTFDFAADWPSDGVTTLPAGVDGADFSIETDGGTGSVTFFNVLVPKDGQPYNVTETDPSPAFDGTEVVCDGFDPVGRDADGDLVGSVLPVLGGNVGCTFTNTERSTIQIIKDVVADDGTDIESPVVFVFDADYEALPFELDDDAGSATPQSHTSDQLTSEGDSYTVTERVPDGYVLDAARSTCSNGDVFGAGVTDGVVITPAPGTMVTCTFVNRALPAGITATKVVEGVVGPWGPFTFTLANADDLFTGEASQPVDNTDVAGGSDTATWEDLVEGETYTLTESQEDGYETGAEFTCTVLLPGGDVAGPLGDADDAAPGFQLTAVAGAIYSCDITNVAIPPTIVVEKTTVGGTGTFTFDITPTDDAYPAGPLTANTAVTNPANTATVDLQAGVGYTVSEQAAAGWSAGALECTVTPADESGQVEYVFGTITQPGDVISCDITNTRRGPVIIAKDAVTDITQTGTTYSVTYEITVSNESYIDETFTLSDTPDMADNVTITSMVVNGPGVVDLDIAPDGGPIIAGAPIAARAGQIDGPPALVYTVVTEFTMTPSNMSQACVDATAGSGAYNGATVTFEEAPTTNSDDACVDLPTPDIEVTKVATTDTATHVSDNTYQALYTVTVDNVGDGPGSYSLADLPEFGVGANVVSTTIVPEPGSPTVIEGGGQDVYTVTVVFTVDGDMATDERECAAVPTAGQGGYNGVTVTWNEGEPSTSADCVDIPNPNVDHSKIVVGDAAVYHGDNKWTVTYQIDVTNLDPAVGDIAGPALYDLTDTFDFGAGVTVDNVVVLTTPDSLAVVAGFDGGVQNVLADGTLISRNETHTYTIVVDVTIAPTEGTNGDCTSGGGLNNAAGLSAVTDPELRPDSEACASFSTLTLIKQLVNQLGANATIEDFILTATLGEDEILSGHTFVTGSVPAGDYVLAETEIPGFATDGFVCGDDDPGSDVTVELGDSVTCTITNVAQPVDLELTKNDDGFTVIAGGAAFAYTITVENVGSRDADLGEAVTVTDELPSPLQWVTIPANCSQSGQTLTCSIDPTLLTVGAEPVVITATVRAPADAPSGTYTNKAYVTTADDPVCLPVGQCVPPPCDEIAFNNNVDCEQTPVAREGAIEVIKTDDVADGDTVNPGDTFAYTLSVKNVGVSSILPGLVVTDDLPAQLSLVSVAGGAGWTCNNADPIKCTYAPSLAPGATAPTITVQVVVNADATGTAIDNTAVVNGAVDDDEPVTDDDNETTPLEAVADLAIVKGASVLIVGAGNQFQWILEVTNNGPAPAVNVKIDDAVPSSLTVTGVSSSFFSCTNSGNAVSCTRPSMAVGESGVIAIDVSVSATAPSGVITNVGTVGSSTPDPFPGNNTDDASVDVVAQAPPTTLPPVVLPPTGSDSTAPLVQVALMLLLLGAAGVLFARRRAVIDDAR